MQLILKDKVTGEIRLYECNNSIKYQALREYVKGFYHTFDFCLTYYLISSINYGLTSEILVNNQDTLDLIVRKARNDYIKIIINPIPRKQMGDRHSVNSKKYRQEMNDYFPENIPSHRPQYQQISRIQNQKRKNSQHFRNCLKFKQSSFNTANISHIDSLGQSHYVTDPFVLPNDQSEAPEIYYTRLQSRNRFLSVQPISQKAISHSSKRTKKNPQVSLFDGSTKNSNEFYLQVLSQKRNSKSSKKKSKRKCRCKSAHKYKNVAHYAQIKGQPKKTNRAVNTSPKINILSDNSESALLSGNSMDLSNQPIEEYDILNERSKVENNSLKQGYQNNKSGYQGIPGFLNSNIEYISSEEKDSEEKRQNECGRQSMKEWRYKGKILMKMKEIFGVEKSSQIFRFIEANSGLTQSRIIDKWISEHANFH